MACTRHFAKLNKTPERPSAIRGFTLFEILVVIFIIGIILTFATLTVGSNADQQVEEEGKRIAALMQLASEEAIINNREIALSLGKTYYEFVDIGGGKATKVEDEGSPLRRRQLPEGLEFRAEINGEEVTLKDEVAPPKDDVKKATSDADDENDESDDNKSKKPQVVADDAVLILLLSSGEVTPFTLEIQRDDGHSYVVQGEYNGQIEYKGRKQKE